MSYDYIGEGPNDRLIVPAILSENGIVCPQGEFKTWKSLHGRNRRGFKKKAVFAFVLARLKNRQGVVATLDADNQPSRIDDLKAARDADRKDVSKNTMPIIVGQANPEVEAWLLDDANAVKKGLQLSAQQKVQSVSDAPDCKVALNDLIEQSPTEAGRADSLEAVAMLVRRQSSRSPDATGLSDFLDDAEKETSRC